jgi:hypothetical protein
MKANSIGLRGDRCLCRACGERFNSTAAIACHRQGEADLSAPRYGRRCLSVPEMISRGMAKNPKGFWLTPRRSPRKPSGMPAYASQEPRLGMARYMGSDRLSNRSEDTLAGVIAEEAE